MNEILPTRHLSVSPVQNVVLLLMVLIYFGPFICNFEYIYVKLYIFRSNEIFLHHSVLLLFLTLTVNLAQSNNHTTV